MSRRLFSIFLAAVMCLSLCAGAWASEEAEAPDPAAEAASELPAADGGKPEDVPEDETAEETAAGSPDAAAPATDGEADGLILNVTSQTEFTDALNRTEPVAEIHITGDFTVTEESLVLYDPDHLPYYSDVVVTIESGVTLTVGDGGCIGTLWPSFEGDWEDELLPNGRMVNNGSIIVEKGGTPGAGFEENNGDILVKDGGEFIVCLENNGTITVQKGAGLRTGMGGQCVNRGTIAVEVGGELEARMGCTIRNEGKLTVDGLFTFGCFSDGGWFDPADGTLIGCGYLCAVPIDTDDVSAVLDPLEAVLPEGTDLKVGSLTEVDTYEKLAAAFSEIGNDIDGNRHVIARITADLTVTDEITALGSVFIPSGVIVTIADGGLLGTGLRCEGAVFVEAGGVLATTMGGPTAIVNDGVIVVHEGGTLVSRMGGSVWNRGLLTLNGIFRCGVFSDQDNFAVWFRSEGDTKGTGTITLWQAGSAEPDKDAVKRTVQAMIGSENAVSIGWELEGLVLYVSNQQELTDALNRTEPVGAIRIVESFTVTKDSCVLFDEAHYPYYKNTVVGTAPDIVLTIGAGGSVGLDIPSFWDWTEALPDEDKPADPDSHIVNNGTIVVEAGGGAGFAFDENNGNILVKDGGEFRVVSKNNGTVTVQSGGAYRTAQGDYPLNLGRVVVEEGAEMEARFGSIIRNEGELVLDGTLIVNCFRYPDQNGVISDHMWFESTKPVSGGGRAVLQGGDPENPEVKEINFTVLASSLRQMLQNDAIEVVFDCYEADLEDFLDDLGEQSPDADVNSDGQFNEEDAVIVVENMGGIISVRGASLLLQDAYALAAMYLLHQIVSHN